MNQTNDKKVLRTWSRRSTISRHGRPHHCRAQRPQVYSGLCDGEHGRATSWASSPRRARSRATRAKAETSAKPEVTSFKVIAAVTSAVSEQREVEEEIEDLL
jgi:hypothetical protein